MQEDCNSGLQSKLSIVNSRLRISLDKQNIVDEKVEKGNNLSATLDGLLVEAQSKTSELQSLQG